MQIVISTSVETTSMSSATKLLRIHLTSSLKERFMVVSLVNMVRLQYPRLISLMLLTQMYIFLSGGEVDESQIGNGGNYATEWVKIYVINKLRKMSNNYFKDVHS